MSLNTLRLRSPADVVSAIPYLIGFHPSDSVVVLVCDRSQGTCAMRLDLDAHEALLEHITDLVARRRPDAVILAGYGLAGRVTPVIERLRGHLRVREVPLRDALRVEDGRYWSYLCADLTCCPPEGTYVDVATNPATAAAVAAGLVALPDRRELERALRSSGDASVLDALARAESEFARWGADGASAAVVPAGADSAAQPVERPVTGADAPAMAGSETVAGRETVAGAGVEAVAGSEAVAGPETAVGSETVAGRETVAGPGVEAVAEPEPEAVAGSGAGAVGGPSAGPGAATVAGSGTGPSAGPGAAAPDGGSRAPMVPDSVPTTGPLAASAAGTASGSGTGSGTASGSGYGRGSGSGSGTGSRSGSGTASTSGSGTGTGTGTAAGTGDWSDAARDPTPDARPWAGSRTESLAGPGAGPMAGSALEPRAEPVPGPDTGTGSATGAGAVMERPADPGPDDDISTRMVMEGVPLVRRVIGRACAGGRMPSADEIAWLGLLLTSLRVRDEAWVRMRERDLDAHIRLWRDVLTRLPDVYAAAPACLLSFAAWRTGDGALANVALDRALAADPHYTMALLLQELFASGLPPWSLRMDLTPDELDETG